MVGGGELLDPSSTVKMITASRALTWSKLRSHECWRDRQVTEVVVFSESLYVDRRNQKRTNPTQQAWSCSSATDETPSGGSAGSGRGFYCCLRTWTFIPQCGSLCLSPEAGLSILMPHLWRWPLQKAGAHGNPFPYSTKWNRLNLQHIDQHRSWMAAQVSSSIAGPASEKPPLTMEGSVWVSIEGSSPEIGITPLKRADVILVTLN